MRIRATTFGLYSCILCMLHPGQGLMPTPNHLHKRNPVTGLRPYDAPGVLRSNGSEKGREREGKKSLCAPESFYRDVLQERKHHAREPFAPQKIFDRCFLVYNPVSLKCCAQVMDFVAALAPTPDSLFHHRPTVLRIPVLRRIPEY